MSDSHFMRLRTCKALKFFAILLFSLEIMAPAIISGNEEASQQETRLVSPEGHLTNFISSLLYEESGSEEERESKDHKSTITFTDFDFFEAFGSVVSYETTQTQCAEPIKTSASQPKLFTLHHTFLI